MMRSKDDKFLCVISSCEEELDSSRITYYMYLFQSAGYNYNFRYKLESDGIRSRGLNGYIDELLEQGYITDGNGILKASKDAIDEVSNYIMSYQDIELHNTILSYIEDLTLTELHFLVVTDMTITEITKTYGIEGLVKKKDEIIRIISSLSKEFSEENLNGAMKIIKVLKRGL